ncbi:MAG: Arc family DNA-binding protein [Bacteroidetes bacterium]|nr:Arc family DNA-binding protein [Bacteroidota bacterium]
MSTYTIKLISPDLLQRIKIRAERNKRSMNQEILYILESAESENLASNSQLLSDIRENRNLFPVISFGEIESYKISGRE